MEDLFNILSSSARIDKSKRPNKKKRLRSKEESSTATGGGGGASDDDDDDDPEQQRDHVNDDDDTPKIKLDDLTKGDQFHREQVAAFRRSMCIKLANKHDPNVPDPITSFDEMNAPEWWRKKTNNDDSSSSSSFIGLKNAILRNIEAGRWKEPTPIQMQSIPTLLERRDLIGCAPTGSGKSGAFLIPALLLSSASNDIFYGGNAQQQQKKKKKTKSSKKKKAKVSCEGEIRSLILAPSLELASQLHREIQRLGTGKPGGLTSILLAKSNAAQVISGNVGGKNGLDVLVSTPLRVVDAIEKGLRINKVRFVVLDEADRLLDATDGKKKDANSSTTDAAAAAASGTAQTRTFLSQMDAILAQIPTSATRGLFSATITPFLRDVAESILRNPVDVTIGTVKNQGGANPDIEQELMFVGREQGKLLAIRQLVQRGQLTPPALIFMQSQERAQALFRELIYDGIHVDVIHAGRSKSARENAVAKFRKGDTWVLICTDLCARGVDFRAVKMVINYDLPASGVTYIHRIGRTGRAGRKGKAITLFTEADFESLRAIANVMKQSGCRVEDWMLNLSRNRHKQGRKARNK